MFRRFEMLPKIQTIIKLTLLERSVFMTVENVYGQILFTILVHEKKKKQKRYLK